MPIVTWDHVHLRSPDPEATAAWLENILGGVIIRGPGRIDVKLGGANVFIAPVAAGDGVNAPPKTPYQGLDHFGLTVKDIDGVAAEIKAKGVEFTKEPTTIRPGVRICFIRGPQGISIELLERRQEIRKQETPGKQADTFAYRNTRKADYRSAAFLAANRFPLSRKFS
jgi:catechol 2,3-dioxygenase-like lactoylglutathione lyase family enzyme